MFGSTPRVIGRMFGGFYGSNRFKTVQSATLMDLSLITFASGMDSEKVIGGPGWIATDRFDVSAIAPSGSTPGNDADDAAKPSRSGDSISSCETRNGIAPPMH